MARPKRPVRARTALRRARTQDEKLVRARGKLIDLAPGGTPERPIDVPTSAVVEPKASAVRCPRCDEPFVVEAHEASTTEHGRLREAKLRCKSCGKERSLWFRVVAPS
jgi:uncharacterized protein with PIN domain